MRPQKTHDERFSHVLYGGLSFYWAWIWLTFFSDILYRHTTVPTGIGRTAMLLSMGGMLAAMAACALLPRSIRLSRTPAVTALAAAGGLGTLVLALAPPDAAGVRLACALGSGIGCGGLLLGWGECYTALAPLRISRHVGLSLIASALVVVAVIATPGRIAGCFDALLPLLSGSCLLALNRSRRQENEESGRINRDQENEQPEKRRGRLFPWRYGAGLVVCGAIIGLSLGVTMGIAPEALDLGALIIVMGNATSGLIIVAYARVTGRDLEYRSTAVILPPLVVVALVLFAAGPHDTVLLAFAFSRVGFGLFDAIVWAQLPRTTDQCAAAPIRVFAFVRLMLDGGVLAGTVCAALLPDSFFTESGVLGIIVAFVLMIILSLLLQPNPTTIPASPAPTRSIEGACVTFSKSCGLSARETEVLTLIVKGRTAKNIADELFISIGTVQTHMKNLYRKCHVHSRYELLTALEDSMERPATQIEEGTDL